jgi:hypothetical protein
MPNKKTPKRDTMLKAFIKSGGRKNAEADFNDILKRAAKPKSDKTSSNSSKTKRP